MTNLDFLKTLARDPRVGALAVSSKYVVRRIVRELPHGARYVVEYGAGDGAITKALVQSLPADGRLVAIERNRQFASELRRIGDPRLTVIENDVVAVSKNLERLGLPRIDAVVSGIPLSFLNRAAREEIIRNASQTLSPGGRCIVYQYSFFVLPLLKKFFKNVRLHFEPRNFLPYFIMVAEK